MNYNKLYTKEKLPNFFPSNIAVDKDALKQSFVEKSNGFPVLSNIRCCDKNSYIGTPVSLLGSEPASISGYGFSQYSDIKKCNLVSEKSIKKINKEIESNNINVDDIFDRKYRNKNNKIANLGKDVISYRIKSSKE